MIGWLNKKLKMIRVKQLLVHQGAGGVYPDALIRQIVNETFYATMCLMKESISGMKFDVMGNWDFYLSPYLKLLTLNAFLEHMQGRVTQAQLFDALRLAVARTPEGLTDVDTFSTDHIDLILKSHSQPSHMNMIRELTAAQS